MAADTCVTIAKYSHATGVRPDNTIPWTHVVASNVYLVLKGEDTDIQNGHVYLQVIQGNTALETIRASELIDKSIETRHILQQAGSAPQIEQLPIFGICKDQFLALRYRYPDGQARRVQFRLQSTQECSNIVNILQQRGMEFQQQRSHTDRPKTGRPGTGDSEARPLTMQTLTPTGNRPAASNTAAKPNPFRLQPLEAGGLSSQTPSSVTLAGQVMPRQSSFNTSVSLTPGADAIHSLPVLGVSTPLAAINSTQPSGQPSESFHTAKHLPIGTSDLHGVTNNSSGYEYSRRNPDIGLSDPSMMVSSPGSELPRNLYSTIAPLLAPSWRNAETLEHEMPPRRELPFKRPSSHSSASSRPSTTSKPGNCSTTVHPGSESSTKSTANTHASRPTTASSLKRAVALNDGGPTKKATVISDRPQTSVAASNPMPGKASTCARPLASGTTYRRPSDLGELLRSSKPLADRSPNCNKFSRIDSTSNAPHELETPPGVSPAPSKLSENTVAAVPTNAGIDTTSSDNGHCKVVGSVSMQPAGEAAIAMVGLKGGSDADLLADYASQSQGDRQAVLDEFMVSKLEDPNFATLCEDVDNCWRKIALGL